MRRTVIPVSLATLILAGLVGWLVGSSAGGSTDSVAPVPATQNVSPTNVPDVPTPGASPFVPAEPSTSPVESGARPQPGSPLTRLRREPGARSTSARIA